MQKGKEMICPLMSRISDITKIDGMPIVAPEHFDFSESILKEISATINRVIEDYSKIGLPIINTNHLKAENEKLKSQNPPCSRTCYHHQTHPCENCGKINGYLPSVWQALKEGEK